ncbi:RING-H2 finger protein ATL77-like [Papaver somniferum]|uniref:RING-H2 finger protein ATL77-like n=1 Tax=Papaver somniferum TaxID=3469 RepID=UPI000E705588|nr:RING-H2 finger protein ATL77-like [Papaver somniferum]
MDPNPNPNLRATMNIEAMQVSDLVADRYPYICDVMMFAVVVRVFEIFQWVTYRANEKITLRVSDCESTVRVFHSTASRLLSNVTSSLFITGILTQMNAPRGAEPVIIPFLQSFFTNVAQDDNNMGRNLIVVTVGIGFNTTIFCEGGDMIDEVLNGNGRPCDFIFRHSIFLSAFPRFPVAFGAVVIEPYGGPEPTMVCSICLEEVPTGTQVACLACEHKFHLACVWRWFMRSISCPLCRFRLPLRGG